MDDEGRRRRVFVCGEDAMPPTGAGDKLAGFFLVCVGAEDAAVDE